MDGNGEDTHGSTRCAVAPVSSTEAKRASRLARILKQRRFTKQYTEHGTRSAPQSQFTLHEQQVTEHQAKARRSSHQEVLQGFCKCVHRESDFVRSAPSRCLTIFFAPPGLSNLAASCVAALGHGGGWRNPVESRNKSSAQTLLRRRTPDLRAPGKFALC